jgi:predicted membrane protein
MCLNCYQPTWPDKKESGCLMIVLYLVVANIVSAILFFTLPFLIPVVVLIFIIKVVLLFVRASATCTHCKSPNLIKIDSPRAKDIIKQHHPGYK